MLHTQKNDAYDIGQRIIVDVQVQRNEAYSAVFAGGTAQGVERDVEMMENLAYSRADRKTQDKKVEGYYSFV